jgi:hypothetical protein
MACKSTISHRDYLVYWMSPKYPPTHWWESIISYGHACFPRRASRVFGYAPAVQIVRGHMAGRQAIELRMELRCLSRRLMKPRRT